MFLIDISEEYDNVYSSEYVQLKIKSIYSFDNYFILNYVDGGDFMRYEYHMGFGNGYGYNMGYGFWGSDILIFVFIIFAVFLFVLFRNKKIENPYLIRLIDILKEKYALGIINADEYIERKAIIEDTKDSNPYITILLKRYAHCEVDTKEFFCIKNEIESTNIDNITKERLAKRGLSYDEFKLRK
jgi:uncharacterized membrane protein